MILVGSLDCYNQVPQIEFAAADNGVALVVAASGSR